jgi:hypothetical protein
MTWNMAAVTPSNATDSWSLGSTIASCSTAASTGSAVKCTATGSQQAAGTTMTLAQSAQAGTTAYGFYSAFSCQ